MSRATRAIPLVLLAGLGTAGLGTTGLRAQSPSAPAEANRSYQAGDWPAAAKAYEALVGAAPDNPSYRYRLGVSLLVLGRPDDALVALAPASQAPPPVGGMVLFGMARAQARLGERDRAFEALKKAVAAGFFQVPLLEAEADLAPLREDARFKEAVAGADRNARPCVYRPESRAFDFWVGDWEVTANGAPAGTSRVERILGDCVILENWTGANGFSGKSFNFFDRAKSRWQQTWVDNVGGVMEFNGEAREGRIEFLGERVLPGRAEPVKNRMTFSSVSPDEVRQLIEQSSDEGATWTVVFDGTYRRKK